MTYAEKKNKVFDILFDRIQKLPSLCQRTVLVEKWIEPHFIKTELDNLDNAHDFARFWFHYDRDPSIENEVTIEWYDDSNRLHNVNGMPARISWDRTNLIKLEWFKHGVPHRKNNIYNVIGIQKHYRSWLNRNTEVFETSLFAEWRNRDGQLHSFNGFPALITKDEVSWYWNGENCRMSYDVDLPCVIKNTGHMTFRRHKNDSPHTIAHSIVLRDVAPFCRRDLHLYEHFVSWPIRKVLTL